MWVSHFQSCSNVHNWNFLLPQFCSLKTIENTFISFLSHRAAKERWEAWELKLLHSLIATPAAGLLDDFGKDHFCQACLHQLLICMMRTPSLALPYSHVKTRNRVGSCKIPCWRVLRTSRCKPIVKAKSKEWTRRWETDHILCKLHATNSWIPSH